MDRLRREEEDNSNSYSNKGYKCSDRSTEVINPNLLGNFDRKTNQPTDRPKTNIRGHREVTIPIIKTNVYALVEV